MTDSVPEKLGKYKIIEEVGRGGFAAVYKAVDTTLDRTVALKVLAPHLLWDPTFVQRFQREAKVAANLDHPHIVTIHEVGQIIGEMVAGRGLGTRFGGDEFTAYLIGHDLEAAILAAEQIRAAVEDLRMETEEDIVRTTISIGVAAAICENLDTDHLCRKADKALYRAKAAGRNIVSD